MKRTIQFFSFNSLVLWIFIFFVSIGYVIAGEPGQVTKVTASIVDETVIAGDQLANEGQTRNLDPFPENPDSYLPMPLPDPTLFDKSDAIPLEKNRVVSYNVATGEETIHEFVKVLGNTPLGNVIEGNLGPGEILNAVLEPELPAGDQASLKKFGSMVRIGSTQTNPWRRNVKLFIKMANGSYVCSGGMIGPRTVLTAGHCVHTGPKLGGSGPMRNPPPTPQPPAGGWATSIVAVPGYSQGWRPYGSASSVQLFSWTGWMQGGQRDHDMGVILLDRSIGTTVGWFGYGWNSSTSWHLTTTWNNASYPGSPFSNGESMYYWFGPGDWWLGKQVGINNRSYSGQNGSVAYRIFFGSRYAHMVLLNVNSTSTRFSVIDQDKFNAIKSFRKSVPAAFDLELLAVEVDTAASTMAYLVANNSAQSWSGAVTANVYLSKNNNISTSDTLIQTHAFEADFGPNGAVEVEVPSLTIPEDTPTGQYWVGVVLDIDDGNLKNNDSDGQDASRVLIIK